MPSDLYRARAREAGRCANCPAPSTTWQCRACQDRANARHTAWRRANVEHFRATQAKQRARRRKLKALAKAGRMSVESRVIEGRRVLIAVVPPGRRGARR